MPIDAGAVTVITTVASAVALALGTLLTYAMTRRGVEQEAVKTLRIALETEREESQASRQELKIAKTQLAELQATVELLATRDKERELEIIELNRKIAALKEELAEERGARRTLERENRALRKKIWGDTGPVNLRSE